MRYEGKLYRALNPIYARELLSGSGVELYRGRFNPKGMPAIYTSLSALTALREAGQIGHRRPTTLVTYDALFERIFDSRDKDALNAEGMDADALADPSWRDEMKESGEARTQRFASRLSAAGYHGLLVRSFAPGASDDDLNLVLWRWSKTPPARLSVIDDENRPTTLKSAESGFIHPIDR